MGERGVKNCSKLRDVIYGWPLIRGIRLKRLIKIAFNEISIKQSDKTSAKKWNRPTSTFSFSSNLINAFVRAASKLRRFELCFRKKDFSEILVYRRSLAFSPGGREPRLILTPWVRHVDSVLEIRVTRCDDSNDGIWKKRIFMKIKWNSVLTSTRL